MAEGEYENRGMEELSQKYPEYDDMNYGQLDYEYNHIEDLLTDDQKIINDEENREYTKKSEYLLKLIRKKDQDSSFIESYDSKTVTINKKGSDTQVRAPRVKFENP